MGYPNLPNRYNNVYEDRQKRPKMSEGNGKMRL